MTTQAERRAAELQLPDLREQVRRAFLQYEDSIDRFFVAESGSEQERYWRQRARHWHETAELLRAKLNRVRAVAEGKRWLHPA